MTTQSFLRFHVHSVHSMRDGLLSIKDLVTKAKEANELVTLTDHGSIGGWIEYYNECKKQDVLPIFGIELYVNNHKKRLKELSEIISNENDSVVKKQLQVERDSKKTNYHLVIVAKNDHGLMNLIKLNNYGYVEGFYNKPLVTYNEIFALPKDENGDRGVIISSACLGGTLGKLVMQAISTKNKKFLLEASDFIQMMKTEFKDDFYIEVQSNNIPEQKKVNKILIELAKKHKVKVIIGMDSHYLTEKQAAIHQDLLLLQDKKLISDLGKVDIKITWENNNKEIKSKKVDPEGIFRKGYLAKNIVVGQTFGKGKNLETVTAVDEVPRVWTFSTDKVYYKSEDELRKEVKKYHKELVEELDTIISNTAKIIKKISPVAFNTIIKLPMVANADKVLTQKVKAALKAQGFVNKEYVDRVKMELERIKENNFETYFLILEDIIQYAKSQDIALGAGRGSAGGSLVAFLLGIHRIDPMDPRWGNPLPFERFLSPDRNSRKVIIQDADGNKKEFVEDAEITIQRKKQQMTIKAIDLQEQDVIL